MWFTRHFIRYPFANGQQVGALGVGHIIEHALQRFTRIEHIVAYLCEG